MFALFIHPILTPLLYTSKLCFSFQCLLVGALVNLKHLLSILLCHRIACCPVDGLFHVHNPFIIKKSYKRHLSLGIVLLVLSLVHGNKAIYSESNSKAGLFPENTVNNILANKTKGIQFKSSGRVGTGAGVFTQVLESSVPHESQANDSVLDDSLSDVQMLYRNSVSDNEDYSFRR